MGTSGEFSGGNVKIKEETFHYIRTLPLHIKEAGVDYTLGKNGFKKFTPGDAAFDTSNAGYYIEPVKNSEAIQVKFNENGLSKLISLGWVNSNLLSYFATKPSPVMQSPADEKLRKRIEQVKS